MPDIVAPPTPAKSPRRPPFSDPEKARQAGAIGLIRRNARARSVKILHEARKMAAAIPSDAKAADSMRRARVAVESRVAVETDAETTETLARAVDRLASAEVKLASIGRIRQSRGPAGDRASGDTSGSPAKSYGRVTSDDE